MKIYNLKRFSKPEFLRQINPKRLLAFLRKFPQCATAIYGHEIDYDLLAKILASPEPSGDSILYEALTMIDEMSDDKNFDLLHRMIDNKPYAANLRDNVTVADLALTLWLHEPFLLENAVDKAFQGCPRSFIYFRGDPAELCPAPGEMLLSKLTRVLNRVFQRKKRGRNVKIVVLDDDEDYRFMVRKGEPYSRDSAIRENGTSGSVYYRPERFDLVVLRPKIAELRLAIYRKAPWLIEAYRTLFGYTFYRDYNFFSSEDVFSLKPLLTEGTDALVCRDIPGIDEVTIVQLKFRTQHGEIYAFHGPGGLGMLKNLKNDVLTSGEIVSAKFKVRLASSTADRMVTVKDGNMAEFKYDADGEIIEQWLIKRKFKNG